MDLLGDTVDKRVKVSKTIRSKINAVLKKITKNDKNVGARVYSNALYDLLEKVSQPVKENIKKLQDQAKKSDIERSQRNQAGGGGLRYAPQSKAKVNTLEGLKQGYNYDTSRTTRSTKPIDNDEIYEHSTQESEKVAKQKGNSRKK